MSEISFIIILIVLSAFCTIIIIYDLYVKYKINNIDHAVKEIKFEDLEDGQYVWVQNTEDNGFGRYDYSIYVVKKSEGCYWKTGWECGLSHEDYRIIAIIIPPKGYENIYKNLEQIKKDDDKSPPKYTIPYVPKENRINQSHF